MTFNHDLRNIAPERNTRNWRRARDKVCIRFVIGLQLRISLVEEVMRVRLQAMKVKVQNQDSHVCDIDFLLKLRLKVFLAGRTAAGDNPLCHETENTLFFKDWEISFLYHVCRVN